jgi:glycosyltransferase involved in cell wall biosynthesis
MNILILNYEYPPLGGGAGLVTQHLAEQFNKRGHHVYILTTWYAGTPEYSVEENITIVRLKCRRKYTYKSNPLEMLSWIKHSKNLFKNIQEKIEIDVCLANFTLPGGEVARYLKKKWNIPFVILSHGHDIPWFSPKQMFWYHLVLQFHIKKIMLEADRNILLTEELKANADKFLGENFHHKNIVIPNGLNIKEAKEEKANKNSQLTILFVGRLVEQKDPITLLKAIKLLENKEIPFHLKIIGDGDLKNEVEKQIYKLKLKSVSLMGKVSNSEVVQEMEAAHILVAASREEAMSLSVLEAVSNGLYVIATNISGNNEVIIENENGNFVKYGDEQDIANKIEQFYLNKFMKGYQYPHHLNSSLANRYSWDSAAQKYLEVFEEILSS